MKFVKIDNTFFFNVYKDYSKTQFKKPCLFCEKKHQLSPVPSLGYLRNRSEILNVYSDGVTKDEPELVLLFLIILTRH